MGKINAKLFSLENGYTSYEAVNAVKIVSKGYNLLIMEDYLPVIGVVENGSVSIIKNEESEVINITKGFYRHSHNEFELLIKDGDI